MRKIKDFIGISTKTTSNNMVVDDTLDIMKGLGLIDYKVDYDQAEAKRHITILQVRNKLQQ